MIAVLLLSLLNSISAQVPLIKLDPGIHVKTLGANCQLEKFKVGPQSAIILESANFNTEYDSNLKCKVGKEISFFGASIN